MVRSMYSGVAGMKAHQTRMDVIGNNIANVNTYGFKSGRATFRDMYYQNIRNAAAGTANRGGISPSAVGYGSAISSIDLMMTQSSFTSTGNPLDVAISGEGFFQVMDNDGNIFYTKAGMLDIDSNGNLIDTNGYFVLGTSGNPLGKAAGSEKISFSIPSVPPTPASVTASVNGVQFTVEATKPTKDGNLSFFFEARSDLPVGQDVKVLIDTGGAITVQLNSSATFNSMGDLQSAINRAITEANGGVAHPAGDFKFTISDPNLFSGGLTGAEICGSNYGVVKGNVTVPDTLLGGNLKFVEVGDKFAVTGVGAVTYDISYTDNGTAGITDDDTVTLTADVDGVTYSRVVDVKTLSESRNLLLTNQAAGAAAEDTITLSIPGWSTLVNLCATPGDPTSGWGFPAGTHGTATPSATSNDIGLSQATLALSGGTEGGTQSVKDLTGIAIGADGTIVATHGVHGEISVGRIDLATFDNPRSLQQSGNSYYAKTANSGEPSLTTPGENGSGALVNSSLEMSNVDLSQEFSDMITTQRGFQANSRMITVSDTMLEELINLKR